MSGLRCLEGGGDGLQVSHLTHQDDLGGLAQGGPQGVGEILGVGANLSLIDGRLVVAVEILDRILNRDDVYRLVVVHPVDERRQRRGFARAGRAGHQHDPVSLPRDLIELAR